MDLYFAGSRQKDLDEEMQKLECNRLLSNFADRSAIKEWVTYYKNNPNSKSKFFIDSGAYSVFHQGKSLDVDDYIDFINEIGDYVTVFAQMDTIQDPNGSLEYQEECQEKTWQNYLYMCKKLRPELVDKLIPLYHAGENIKRFHNLLEYTHPDGHHIKYIGLGAPQGVYRTVRSQYYDEWFKIIRASSNPNVKTHAFGCTDLKILESFPFTSADSASWIRSAAAGNILVDDKWVSLSSRSSDWSKRYSEKDMQFKHYIENYVKDRGFTVEQLQSDSKSIYLYNIRYLKNWADNYKCTYNHNKPRKIQLF